MIERAPGVSNGQKPSVGEIEATGFQAASRERPRGGFETLQDVAIGFGVHDVDENVREKTSGRRRYGF